MFQNPPGERRVNEDPSSRHLHLAFSTDLPHLSPSSGWLPPLTASVPHPPAWRALRPAMTLTFPGFLVKQPQEESVSLSTSTSFLGERQRLEQQEARCTNPDQLCVGGREEGRRKGGERAGLSLITMSFRNPSLTTYKLCELGTQLNLFESY